MRIAILGATSQIAKDLVLSFSLRNKYELVLYCRRPRVLNEWLQNAQLASRYVVSEFSDFTNDENFDAILNFVGVGDPAQAAAMGAIIFDVTLQFDEMALKYVKQHPLCRYIFLSSGAAYGSSFDAPADEKTKAVIAINSLHSQDWYSVAKLHAECRHRSLPHLPIVDIRVFNYFSHTQDLSARFLITDILRAIRDQTVLTTSPAYMARDYLHPSDFHQLVLALLTAPPENTAVDCYSRAPIDKISLLTAMQEKFNLQYVITEITAVVNATGAKPHYYSLNTRAADLGYQPAFSSLQGVLQEAQRIL